jgi:hypothetical protein
MIMFVVFCGIVIFLLLHTAACDCEPENAVDNNESTTPYDLI